jgi:hypothetical protein
MDPLMSPDKVGGDQNRQRQGETNEPEAWAKRVWWQEIVARADFEDEEEHEIDDDPTRTLPATKTEYE